MYDKETDIDKQLPTEREAHDIRLALAMMDGKGLDVEAEWALMSERIDRDEACTRHRKRRAMLWAAVPLAAAAVAALFAIAGKQPQPVPTQHTIITATNEKPAITMEADGEEAVTLSGQTITMGKAARGATATPGRNVTISTSRGRECNLELADGSKVWMNAESKLTIAKDYGQASRTLWLEGEAYFEVAPDSKRPFTVHSGKFSTTAVGTTFNINTSAPAGKPDIVLVEGCVDISLAASPGKRRMHTGQTATLGDGGTLTVADADTYPYTQRRNGFFYFEQEPLLTIMAELGRWYNKTVVFENEQAMQTRLHFVAERGQDLKDIIASLNDMDGVDISAEAGCLVVK